MGFRYIGTKTALVEAVVRHISDLAPPGATVADLMAGTAAVSTALRASGYRVIANDVMTYSYHHARVALLFTAPPRFRGLSGFLSTHDDRGIQESLFAPTPYERTLDALSRVPPLHGYFFKELSLAGRPANGAPPRNYFTPANAATVDAVRCKIGEFRRKKLITTLEHSLLQHDLIMAANDVANIAGTYGHFLSKTVERATFPLRLTCTPLQMRADRGWHKVFREYAETLAPRLECDVCYIDPPYMKRQYAANYHVLETLARGDSPEAIGLSGLRPWRDQYSDFCTKTRIRGAFQRLFRDIRCQHFLVSYSEDGLLTLDELAGVMGEFGTVNGIELINKRFKSHDRKASPHVTEYLLHLRRKALGRRR
jgi:adenine-specific DNA-methyltransferase